MKKKMFALLISASLVAGMLSGCGASAQTSSNGMKYNKEYDEESLFDITGNKQDLTSDSFVSCKTAGFGFVEPASWASIANTSGLYEANYSPDGYMMEYIPADIWASYEALDDTSSEEEAYAIINQIYATMTPLFSIYRVNQNDSETVEYADFFSSNFDNIVELATIGDDVFYFACVSAAPSLEEYSDSDKADIQIIFNSLEELKNSIVLFPPTDPLEDFKVDMTSFTTTDLDGNEITADIFADYDVTMINIWATWCQYCIEEMPAIEKLYEDKADNVNIITICMDAEDEMELAISEMEQVGATFTVLVGNEELQDKIDPYLSGYPTTFFVDSRGNIVGELLIGTPASDEDEICEAYAELIEKALN